MRTTLIGLLALFGASVSYAQDNAAPPPDAAAPPADAAAPTAADTGAPASDSSAPPAPAADAAAAPAPAEAAPAEQAATADTSTSAPPPDVAPRQYLSFMGSYEFPDKKRGLPKRKGAGATALYGYLFSEHFGIEIGYHGAAFERGPTGGSDFYQHALQVDGVFNLTDRARSALTPYLLVGGGGVYDDVFPGSGKKLNGFAEGGAGLVTGVLSDNFPVKFRLEGRFIRDFYKLNGRNGFNDYRASAGLEIPLGRMVRYIEVPVEKVHVEKEVVQVPRPWVDSDGDGVDDEHDKCPDTPKGLKVDSDGCAIPGQSIELRGVTFEFNKARLMPNAQTVLDYVTKGLLGQPTMKVELAGHTDTIGSAEYNQKLSQKRAESVRQYLIGKGVKPEQLVAKGYGKSQLLVNPEKTDADRELNRRVEFRVLEK